MSTLSELIEFIQIRLNDPSILEATITDRINSVVKRIAGGVYDTKTGGLTPPLPELYAIDEVYADNQEAYVKLPTNYQRNLCFCANSTERIKIYDSFSKFIGKYPLLDDSGSVYAVSVKNRDLYYQALPTTAEALTIHYYRNPGTLVDDSDEPEGIPTFFHQDIIVPMVCELLCEPEFKPVFNAEALRAIAEFREFLGPEDKEPVNIDDSTDYI